MDLKIKVGKKSVHAKTPGQIDLVRSMRLFPVTFGIGPAGTGKTFVSVAAALELMFQGDFKRLVICRPAVEAGEKIGFLPGNLQEKVDPYLRPVFDALEHLTEKEEREGRVEVAPLAFMRGRTFHDAFVIVDEAQNSTPLQMEMMLTRIGQKSRIVVVGDPNQSDIGINNGLADAIKRFAGFSGMGFAQMGKADNYRHPIIKRITDAYHPCSGGDSADSGTCEGHESSRHHESRAEAPVRETDSGISHRSYGSSGRDYSTGGFGED